MYTVLVKQFGKVIQQNNTTSHWAGLFTGSDRVTYRLHFDLLVFGVLYINGFVPAEGKEHTHTCVVTADGYTERQYSTVHVQSW